MPVFHALSSENHAAKWDFFVDHYSDQKRRERDPKYSPDWSQVTEPPKDPDLSDVGQPDVSVGPNKKAEGVLYPRYAALGGCTAHNAMITVYPHNADWDYIETLTGDKSWSHKNMRKYFQRLERCRHRPFWRWLRQAGVQPDEARLRRLAADREGAAAQGAQEGPASWSRRSSSRRRRRRRARPT